MYSVLKPIVFHEHQKKFYEGDGYAFSEREIALIDRANRTQDCELFRLYHNALRATQYVGFMRIGPKTLQVVPKIFKENTEADLHFLFYLLTYTRKLNLKHFSLLNLERFRGDFFEVLIGIFAENVNKRLRHDLKRNYVSQEEPCPFLRGKLLVSTQIRRGTVDRSNLFCRYDEFTEDNLINRTLKCVCALMLRTSKNQANCKILEHNLMLLADVRDQRIIPAEIDRIHFTRLNVEYKPLIDLCRLFLSKRTVSLQSAGLETFSFMFDMNRLFEEFIFQFLCTHKTALGLESVDGQRKLGRLFDEFNMIYDVLVETVSGDKLLIDSKYKAPDNQKRHQGLAQSDFYQMFAYALSQEKKYRRVVLLYPKSEMREASFLHDNADHTVNLDVRCVDLEKIWDQQNRKLDENALIDDLKRWLSK